MKKKTRYPAPTAKDTPIKTFKVRLDEKTVITLSNEKALDFWRERYPKLQVIG